MISELWLMSQDTMHLFMQLFAVTFSGNQSESPIHWTRHSIGSSQWLLQAVSRKVASRTEAFTPTHHSIMPSFISKSFICYQVLFLLTCKKCWNGKISLMMVVEQSSSEYKIIIMSRMFIYALIYLFIIKKEEKICWRKYMTQRPLQAKLKIHIYICI